MLISNNAGLVSAASSGTGDAAIPFIIQGLNITSNSAILIQISGTTKHFIIENNWLDGVDQSYNGIWLFFIANATVRNNIIKN